MHVQRPDLRVRIVVLDRDRARPQRQEHGHRDQRRGEPAGNQRPGGEPQGTGRRHPRGADRHRPPQRATPGGLPRRDRVHHGHAAQVGHHRPAGGGGPGGQLASPARQRGHPHQVGGAAPALPRSHPGGHARHQRRETQQGLLLEHRAAQVPQRRNGHARAVGAEPEHRAEQRQHPPHRGAAQLDPQQSGSGQRASARGARRPVPDRGVGRGGHDRAAVVVAPL